MNPKDYVNAALLLGCTHMFQYMDGTMKNTFYFGRLENNRMFVAYFRVRHNEAEYKTFRATLTFGVTTALEDL